MMGLRGVRARGSVECCLHVAEHLLHRKEHVLRLFNIFGLQEARLDSCEVCSHLLIRLQCSEGQRVQMLDHQREYNFGVRYF